MFARLLARDFKCAARRTFVAMANCPAELDFLLVATLTGCVVSWESEVAEEVVAADDTPVLATEELLELKGVSALGPCEGEGSADAWAVIAEGPDPERLKPCVEELQQDSSAPQNPWKGSTVMSIQYDYTTITK